jgi:hypothetical protein
MDIKDNGKTEFWPEVFPCHAKRSEEKKGMEYFITTNGIAHHRLRWTAVGGGQIHTGVAVPGGRRPDPRVQRLI